MPPKNSEKRCYAVLFSIHFVVKAEKLLKEQGILYELAPIPRAIGSSCGMALEFPCCETGSIRNILHEADIAILGFYRRTCDDEFVALALRDAERDFTAI